MVVVAGGNDGNATSAVTDPAMDSFVIAVGASSTNGTVTTNDDDVAPFVNYWSVSSGSRWSFIKAPAAGRGFFGLLV